MSGSPKPDEKAAGARAGSEHPPTPEDAPLAAGDFASWLGRIQRAIAGEDGSELPCDGCTACCRSGQFVAVGPNERDALARIPSDLLFPAPRRPEGHRVLALTADGHCPMLVDGHCSIYEHRPAACRAYDCRIFAATGVVVGPSQPAVARQVVRWQFDFDSEFSLAGRDACRTAARFLQGQPDLWTDGVPTPARLAAAAVMVHDCFQVRDQTDRARPPRVSPEPVGGPDELAHRLAPRADPPSARSW